MDDHKMKKSVGVEQRDRLSELPLSLIFLILSFLPMRDVVSTTFLSKRWENLWTTVPCLNFCETSKDGAKRFRNFVNRALILWEGTRILKFEIYMRSYFDKSLASDMDSWVRLAVKHKVEELNIHLKYKSWYDDALMCSKRDVYTAPRCLATCESIKKLSLVGCSVRIHESPTLDHLESLKMDGFYYGEHMIDQILSGSPRLEVFELRLLESNENLSIRSRSLKKLRIEKYTYFESDRSSRDTVLRICCPNLETFKILECYYAKCLFTDVSSLTDATIEFYDPPYRQKLGEALRQILSHIQHVENLTLSVYPSEVLGRWLRTNLLSPLPNVKFLRLTDNSLGDIEYGDVMNLLVIFPNINTFVVDDHTFAYFLDPPQFEINSLPESFLIAYFLDPPQFEINSLPESFLMQLKTVQITSSLFGSSICLISEFLLRHGSALETLEIVPKPMGKYPMVKLLKLVKMLSSLQRSSPTAKVIIQGGHYLSSE